MDEQTGTQILLEVGKLGGQIEAVQLEQTRMHEAIQSHQESTQQELKSLRKEFLKKDKEQDDCHKELERDVAKFKLKTFGFAALLSTVSGYLSKFIP